MLITIGLGNIESMLLNIASLYIDSFRIKVIILYILLIERGIWIIEVILPMIKAILLERNCLLTFNVGLFLDYIGNIVRYLRWVFIWVYKSVTTSCSVRIIKDKSFLSKGSVRINKRTSGSPKACKSYGDGGKVLPYYNKGRLPVVDLFNVKSYSTRGGATYFSPTCKGQGINSTLQYKDGDNKSKESIIAKLNNLYTLVIRKGQ